MIRRLIVGFAVAVVALVVAADVASAHRPARSVAPAPNALAAAALLHECEVGAASGAQWHRSGTLAVAPEPTPCPPNGDEDGSNGDKSKGDKDECKSAKDEGEPDRGDGVGDEGGNGGDQSKGDGDKCDPDEHEQPEAAQDGDADDAAPAPVVVPAAVVKVVPPPPPPPTSGPRLLGAVQPAIQVVPAARVAIAPAPAPTRPAPPEIAPVPPLVLNVLPPPGINAGVARATVASVAGPAVGVTVACMVAGLLGSALVLRRR